MAPFDSFISTRSFEILCNGGFYTFGVVCVDTERGMNQSQVKFGKNFNLYLNHIIYSIISN
jgi:hypothetical protein